MKPDRQFPEHRPVDPARQVKEIERGPCLSDLDVAPAGASGWPELFIWRGPDASSLMHRLQWVQAVVSRVPFATLAATVARSYSRSNGSVVLAIVAVDRQAFATRIAAVLARLSTGEPLADPVHDVYSGTAGRPKVGFLFAGQGAQRVSMLESITAWSPLARELWARADYLLADVFDRPLSTFVYPSQPAGGNRTELTRALTSTDVAQPAIGVADMIVYGLLDQAGLKPDMACGHSYGEYVALTAAGVFTFDELVTISAVRGRAIKSAGARTAGSMLAVGAEERDVRTLLPDQGAVIANLNSPSQTVVSGTVHGVEAVAIAASKLGIGTTPINVSAPFHSPLLASASGPLEAVLQDVDCRAPRFDVYSNESALPHASTEIRERMVAHLTSPVRFVDCVLEMARAGADIFVEVGPGTILTKFVRQTLGDVPVIAIPTSDPRADGVTSFLRACATLAVAGVPFDVASLYRGRSIEPVELPDSAPGGEGQSTDQMLARHAALLRRFLRTHSNVMETALGRRRPRPSPPSERQLAAESRSRVDDIGSATNPRSALRPTATGEVEPRLGEVGHPVVTARPRDRAVVQDGVPRRKVVDVRELPALGERPPPKGLILLVGGRQQAAALRSRTNAEVRRLVLDGDTTVERTTDPLDPIAVGRRVDELVGDVAKHTTLVYTSACEWDGRRDVIGLLHMLQSMKRCLDDGRLRVLVCAPPWGRWGGTNPTTHIGAAFVGLLRAVRKEFPTMRSTVMGGTFEGPDAWAAAVAEEIGAPGSR